ncbi:uncharacterized protein LOC18771586 isoform X1 [Prunus persica]|uniref:uncharacterized protein LOC18771586 isoform X1 n=1 Tax=Prunus persica TaxID=3760 RepID=UPI0009AB41E2|nr:uncharacterized protein LOC18771586 isoform X1 [Prunus persica]
MPFQLSQQKAKSGLVADFWFVNFYLEGTCRRLCYWKILKIRLLRNLWQYSQLQYLILKIFPFEPFFSSESLGFSNTQSCFNGVLFQSCFYYSTFPYFLVIFRFLTQGVFLLYTSPSLLQLQNP